MCCTQSVHPWNKRIHKPTAVIAAPIHGSVSVKAGSGMTVVKGVEEFADLPVDIEPLCFDATRDGDARFRSVYLGDREDVRNNDWVLAGARLTSTVGEVLPIITGAQVTAEDTDVFGDRHWQAGRQVTNCKGGPPGRAL